MSEAAAAAGASRRRPGRSDRAEYGVCCVVLALAGVVVLVDALQLSNNRTGVDPLGPEARAGVRRQPVDRAGGRAGRRGRPRQPGEAEAGEDIDLQPPSRHQDGAAAARGVRRQHRADRLPRLGDQRRPALLRLGHRAGQPALHPGPGDRAALSLGTFYGFAIGLGVGLPAGILQGIL